MSELRMYQAKKPLLSSLTITALHLASSTFLSLMLWFCLHTEKS
jgi:hypothetical protein